MKDLEQEALDLTRALLRLNSINPPGPDKPGEASCATFLAERLAQGGFEIEQREFGPGRRSLVARKGAFPAGPEGGHPLCFTGHIDTVPLGKAAWSVDPFGAEIVGDRLYGRGASDMKAGVAAFVTAALHAGEALAEGPGLVLVITAGEETGCEGARHLATGGDDVLGEAGAIVVAEPTSNRPFVGHKGAVWLSARSEGKTAHGSMPERGVNAIYRAARMIAKLEDFGFNQQPHPVLGSPSLNVGTIHGGLNINSVPDAAEVGIDIRSLPGMDHRRIREDLERYLQPDLAELEILVDMPPVWTDPAHPWLQRVRSVVTKVAGAETTGDGPAGASYFTDACVLQPAYQGAPTTILGPGEMAMAHQTDEYCLVSRIGQAARIYQGLIADWQAAPL